ncbi:FixH family protein [Rhodobacter sp. KR11]|nr:FixH family protein [Rhodobacter sp. KR11]
MERLTDMTTTARPWTGWHMLGFASTFFAVIIGVNGYMAYRAISGFPGPVVASSYAESQSFDRLRLAQEALGWTVVPGFDAAARQLRIRITDRTGAPVVLADLEVLVGLATTQAHDVTPTFAAAPDGTYVAGQDLALGKWMMQITAHAQDGTLYQGRSTFYVRD